MISIEIVTAVDAALTKAVALLIPQLSSSSPAPTREQLGQIIGDPATSLFVARDEGRIVGSLTLVAFRIPTGVRAIIEDVVTDDSSRGKGVATQLVEAALAHARDVGARTVDLTSRPDRQAANRLYVRLGFEQRHTNVYRYSLSE
ncbi:MAG TPA: GNAT family N-acetyltransferase [Acidimicrobiales bacterium]